MKKIYYYPNFKQLDKTMLIPTVISSFILLSRSCLSLFTSSVFSKFIIINFSCSFNKFASVNSIYKHKNKIINKASTNNHYHLLHPLFASSPVPELFSQSFAYPFPFGVFSSRVFAAFLGSFYLC